MRPKTITEGDILSFLSDESEIDGFSDDSDADKTWQPPVINKNTAYDEDDDEEEDNGFEQVSDHDFIEDTSKTLPTLPLHNQPQTPIIVTTTSWAPVPFNGIQLPDQQYGPHDFKVIESASSYIKKYLPDSHFDEAALFTNMYAMSKLGKELKTCANEIKVLYGAHAMIGIIKYPRIHMYWQRGIQFDLIAQAITRDRFFLLRSCLHYVDINNRPPQADRFWKIKPIIDSVRNACLSIPRNVSCFSIDEQMIPFLGRIPYRQYVRNKPRPVGLKNFVITTSKGLVLDFEIYQGENTPLDRSLGLGPAVVLRLAKTIPEHSVLFFDRYFTTVPLLDRLNAINIKATGTIMNNRLKNIHFSEDKKFKQGKWEELTRSDDKIVAIKWKDSKCVTVLSTATGAEPHTMVTRWSKSEKKYIEVPCPLVVKTYNQNMGGVDVCDQQLEAYRTWVKTKKWTLKVALHFIDLSIVNAWMEYRQDALNMGIQKKNIKDLMEFKMEIARNWLAVSIKNKRPLAFDSSSSGEDNLEPTEPQHKIQNYRTPFPPEHKAKDKYEHWPIVDDLKTARNCRNKKCKSRTRVRCSKCNIYLCLSTKNTCFKDFHV